MWNINVSLAVTPVAVAHVVLGVAALVLGLTALFAPKARTSLHPQAGRLYFLILTPALALGMADGLIRHPGFVTPFQVATPPTFVLALLGYLMARTRPATWLGQPWVTWHITGMGGSFIGVITAVSFQVFPRLLPNMLILTISYWVIPAAAGSVLIARAISRRARLVFDPDQVSLLSRAERDRIS